MLREIRRKGLWFVRLGFPAYDPIELDQDTRSAIFESVTIVSVAVSLKMPRKVGTLECRRGYIVWPGRVRPAWPCRRSSCRGDWRPDLHSRPWLPRPSRSHSPTGRIRIQGRANAGSIYGANQSIRSKQSVRSTNQSSSKLSPWAASYYLNPEFWFSL